MTIASYMFLTFLYFTFRKLTTVNMYASIWMFIATTSRAVLILKIQPITTMAIIHWRLSTTWAWPLVLSMDTSWTGLLMVSFGFQFQTNSGVDVISDSLFKYITYVLYEINVIGCTDVTKAKHAVHTITLEICEWHWNTAQTCSDSLLRRMLWSTVSNATKI